MARKIFVNLPVNNLKSSMDFFSSLGLHLTRNSPTIRRRVW